MERGHRSHNRNHWQQLTSLRESIVDKPPYINGTLQLPDSCFSLFYKVAKDGLAARYINFANATPDELEQLTQACIPASFGVKQENVLDETYREAGKMDSECFSSMLDPFHTDLIKIIRGYLLEGFQSTKGIKAELYKLNTYSKGSFLKPHVDTPRSERMFGSLVVVFPTPHEGGALFLRHHGHEWIVDSNKALAAVGQPAMGYVAFFGDIEHEVAPITSGYRITLTYNLYFDDDEPAFAVSEPLVPPKPPNQEVFHEAFKALLENPEFMADGGTLAFGLRHTYMIKAGLDYVYSVLKGSDAVVYQSTRALGFEPVLYVYYFEEGPGDSCDVSQGTMVDKLVKSYDTYESSSILDVVRGGILARQDGRAMYCRGDFDFDDAEPVEWVTPLTTYNCPVGAFASHRDESMLGWVTPLTTYNCQLGAFESHRGSWMWNWGVCMVVRIGKTGDRLAYPTAAQVKRAQEQMWNVRED